MPSFGPAATLSIALEIQDEARKYVILALEVLHKIADSGQSKSARVSAGKSILDRAIGTVAVAKVPDGAFQRPLGKKEEQARTAKDVGTGR
jgi:hypothetical protein